MEEKQTDNQSQPMDGKTIAIISYITIIGWIIAYIQFGKNKSSLVAFHLRQSLFIMLCALCVQIVYRFMPYLGWTISSLFSLSMLGFLVLWIIGLIGAINGEEKAVPILGNKAQELLKGIQ